MLFSPVFCPKGEKMKTKIKIIAISVAAVMALSVGSFFLIKGLGNKKTSVFDEENIVLSFSAMSDVHQQHNKQSVQDKLVNALDYAEELNGKPLDVAVFAGDLTERTWNVPISDNYNENYNADFKMFKDAIDKSLDPSLTSVFYCLGNHDNGPHESGVAELMPKIPTLFHSMLGDEYFADDADDSDIDGGRRHAIVNGYHFLSVNADKYWTLRGYSDETLTWLDNQLKVITKENPEQYVFVVGHPPLYETVFSSYRSDWADKDVYEVLEKYPQAMYFSGHIHNVLQDEIQVSQNGSFTALDCGSVKYSLIMNDVNEAGTIKFDNSVGTREEDFSQGLLVQVDKSGNVRVIRCDYYKRSPIKDAWEFEYPKKDNAHLAKYDNDTRANNNVAPIFASDAKITVTKSSSNKVSFTWDSATDDDMVRYYRLAVYKSVDGKKEKIKTYNVGTMTYQYLKASDMPSETTFTVVADYSGEYVFEIVAVDVWNKPSKPISLTVTL